MDLQDIADRVSLEMEAPRLAAEIVCAYVSNNSLPASELPKLIQATHAAILALGTGDGKTTVDAKPEPATPAEIRKSITPDALISFLDGKPYKTLKRHPTCNGLSPAQYRARFALPADYPLVAPSYSAQRSNLAKSIGLGRPGALLKAA